MSETVRLTSDPEGIQVAADLIRSGEIVAFPTETVYGLGADAFNKLAVAKIFEVKRRPHFDPLIVHIGSKEQLLRVAASITEKARHLMSDFWPGPLTLILKKRRVVVMRVVSNGF